MKKKWMGFLIIALVITISLGLFFQFKDAKDIESLDYHDTRYDEIVYKDFKYKITYSNDLDNDSYDVIYVMPNSLVKVVEVTKEYKFLEGNDALGKPTGKMLYKESEYNFSKEAEIVYLNELKKLGKKEVDLRKKNIDDQLYLVLEGLVFGDDDIIMVRGLLNDMKYFNRIYLFNSCPFNNSIKSLKDNYNNRILNKISFFINNKINQEIEGNLKDILSLNESNMVDKVKIDYNVNLETINRDSVVFKVAYTADILEHKDAIRYYNFNLINGEVLNLSPGHEDYYFNLFLNHFKTTPEFINNEANFDANYESVIRNNIFSEGNWYSDSKKTYFYFDPSLIGVTDSNDKYMLYFVLNLHGTENGHRFAIDDCYNSSDDKTDRRVRGYRNPTDEDSIIFYSGNYKTDVVIDNIAFNNEDVNIYVSEVSNEKRNERYGNYYATKVTFTNVDMDKVHIISRDNVIYKNID